MTNLNVASKNDFDSLQKVLRTALICDILDDMGYRNQAMKGNISPLDDSYRLFGRAKTMLTYDVYEMPEHPYKAEIEAVDSIQPGDVVVAGMNHGRSNTFSNGFWGELLATAASSRGGRGAIIDGAIRDIAQLKRFGEKFQTFAAGRNPLDSKGRCIVAKYDCPVMCDGVLVKSGDYIFADIDGIVVIPGNIYEKTLELALEKAQKEDMVRSKLMSGHTLSSVFAEYKIL